jgi:hypothetical protein
MICLHQGRVAIGRCSGLIGCERRIGAAQARILVDTF